MTFSKTSPNVSSVVKKSNITLNNSTYNNKVPDTGQSRHFAHNSFTGNAEA